MRNIFSIENLDVKCQYRGEMNPELKRFRKCQWFEISGVSIVLWKNEPKISTKLDLRGLMCSTNMLLGILAVRFGESFI